MKSLLELLTTILSISHVNDATKIRAGFLKSRIERRDPFAAIFGAAR